MEIRPPIEAVPILRFTSRYGFPSIFLLLQSVITGSHTNSLGIMKPRYRKHHQNLHYIRALLCHIVVTTRNWELQMRERYASRDIVPVLSRWGNLNSVSRVECEPNDASGRTRAVGITHDSPAYDTK
jgi:hypothetical protein